MARHGLENLRPVKTKEEARERGRNGGIASGEAKRKKKTMKELFEVALERPPTKASDLDTLAEFYGISAKEVTSAMAVIHKALERAEEGNTRAMEFVRDTSGNKLAEKMQVEQTTDINGVSEELQNLINAKRENDTNS